LNPSSFELARTKALCAFVRCSEKIRRAKSAVNALKNLTAVPQSFLDLLFGFQRPSGAQGAARHKFAP
jgi:hypothetical protein